VKIAACFGPTTDVAAAAVARMQTAQRLRPWHEPVSITTPYGVLGGVKTSDRYSKIPAVYEGSEARLFVSGTPISFSTPVFETLRGATEQPWPAAVESLKGLEGPFAAVSWHDATRRLTVVTDILGMQPLYCHRRPGMLALASDAGALVASGVCGDRPDPAGWGAFLSFGHTIADRTLFADVRRVPAGAVLVYEPETDRLSISSYWTWPPVSDAPVNDATIDALGDIITGEIRACLEYHPRPFVCLSGGYDSRLILAAVLALGHRPPVLTLAHPDEQADLDGKLALRIARVFNVDVEERTPSREFFSSDEFLEYVRTSGLASPSLYLFIAQLSCCLRTGVEAVWDGIFPGCALFPVHQHPGAFDDYLRHTARTDNALWTAARRLFRPEFVTAMHDEYRDVLATERAQYADDETGVSQFVVRNRTRHRIAPNPLQVFSNDVVTLTPGLSKPFWSMAAAIPTSAKRGHQLYRRLFERRFPKALDVPAVSGGTIDRFNRRLDPDLLTASLAQFIQRRPRLSAALSRAGVNSGPYWKRSRFLDEQLSPLDTDADFLNAGAVEQDKERELLFYWQMMRRIGRGSP